MGDSPFDDLAPVVDIASSTEGRTIVRVYTP